MLGFANWVCKRIKGTLHDHRTSGNGYRNPMEGPNLLTKQLRVLLAAVKALVLTQGNVAIKASVSLSRQMYIGRVGKFVRLRKR